MAAYRLKIIDRFKRILAESDIDEPDAQSACRAVTVALTLFAFGRADPPDASIELWDHAGARIACISI